jgi:hypothetical protein
MRALFALIFVCLPNVAHAQTADMCALLARNPAWTDSLKAAQTQWQVSPGVILAVIDQESRFNPNARGLGASGVNPTRNFGYSQANLQTWNWFLRDTGKTTGSRSDFGASADFIGWHFATMERRIGANRSNTTAHYLAYKMGEGGYKRGAPASARAIATRIAGRARTIDTQLSACGF